LAVPLGDSAGPDGGDSFAPEGPEGARFRCPNSGFLALQSAMSLASIGGSGFVAFGRWGTPNMIGSTQSTINPTPSFAAPDLKPAWVHACFICMQGAFSCALAGPQQTFMINAAAVRTNPTLVAKGEK
jgi:hypothetical protein